MKELTVYQLFCKIRGKSSIEPIGSTYADKHKLTAQGETQELASYLIDDIARVAQTKGNEFSIKEARDYAIRWLKEIKDFIDEVIKEME